MRETDDMDQYDRPEDHDAEMSSDLSAEGKRMLAGDAQDD